MLGRANDWSGFNPDQQKFYLELNPKVDFPLFLPLRLYLKYYLMQLLNFNVMSDKESATASDARQRDS